MMRLLNVLIVDDESFVVDWLSSLIEDHPKLSFDIYRAYNSAEAVEKLERIRIDVLISDIKMPDMDGFQLAKIAVHNWTTCKVILLTAHADFNYVHSALNQGVVSYILKTETDEYIIKELERTISMIEQEVTQTLLLEDVKRDRDAYYYQLQRYAFFNWLHNESEPSTVNKYLDTLGFKIDGAQYCLLIGSINMEGMDNNSEESNSFFQAKVIILRKLREYVAHYAMEPDKHRMIWILQPQQVYNPRFTSLLRGLLESVQQFFQENYNMKASFLLSELTSSPSDMAVAYSASMYLLQRMQANDGGYIFTYSIADAQNMINEVEARATLGVSPYIKLIKTSLEAGQYDICRTALANVCANLRTCEDWQDNAALETYFSVALTFLNEIYQRKQKPNDVWHLFQPWRHPNWAAACSDLERLYDKLFELQVSDKQQNIQQIIHTVESYILTHINEDISLTVLSDIVGYNASYLSRFYSENTNRTISEFIAQQKMKLVDSLMQAEPALSLNQVAEQAGFSSRTYFNNYVKRVTGLSPQKYREQLM